jgi:uncharacterized LabA/DUF88 family protein
MARKKNTETPVTEEVKTQDPTVTSETPVISNEESEKQEQDTVEITAADLVPVIQQKGVDMRLGLDIAALTLKDQVKVIVLVAGEMLAIGVFSSCVILLMKSFFISV